MSQPDSARKTVLITGASAGIGAATAIAAARAGWDIGIGYRTDLEGAQSVATRAQAHGAKTVLLQGDMADESDILRIFAECAAALGPLAGLVNNAGIVDRTQRVEDMSRARLEAMFRINTIGVMQCAQEAVKRMAHRYGGAGGAIVNVSSVAARTGSANQYVDYAASKAAIDIFTTGLAQENAREGIRVNAIRPGITRTEIHAKGGEPGREDALAHLIPMGRAGAAEEIAAAVVFLLSEQASYMTGAIMDVGGGR
jgi:glucose 1-dehydrogenase